MVRQAYYERCYILSLLREISQTLVGGSVERSWRLFGDKEGKLSEFPALSLFPRRVQVTNLNPQGGSLSNFLMGISPRVRVCNLIV